MKKSILSLALAAAFPAVALAQTNVVLNGSIDQSLEYFDSDLPNVDSDIRVTNGVWAGSRFAISGTEELGGGLKGIFNIEHRLSPDTGTQTETRFWHGQAWVGLDGGFGRVMLGRQYTPMYYALVVGDTTGYSFYNDAFGLAGTAGRFDNDVMYQSPSLAGFTIRGAYAAGENAVDDKLGDAYAVSGVGAFGPLRIGLAYTRIDAGDTGIDDTTEMGAALGAKFGNFGVGVAYAQNEIADNKRKAAFLSGSAGFGPGTVYLTLSRDDQGTDLDNDGLGLTYSHGLSKRTFVYAALGYNKIEQATGGDIKPKALALGVRHFF